MNALSAEFEDLKQISLDEILRIRSPGTYLVRVDGHSMVGAGIFSGDILIVDKAGEAKHGSIVVAAVNGEAFCKRLCFEDGNCILRSESSKYPPRQILESDTFEVWGVVTHSVRDHDKRQG